MWILFRVRLLFKETVSSKISFDVGYAPAIGSTSIAEVGCMKVVPVLFVLLEAPN